MNVFSIFSCQEKETKLDNMRNIALGYIWSYLGKWYKWGGDDPAGFDCSGLAVEYLKSIGAIKRKSDYTAAALFKMFKDLGCEVEKPHKGCLVFWENENHKIIHVEIMLNEKQTIGASGGGSKTLTEADAIKHNAFIKVRTFFSRPCVAGFVDPFLLNIFKD